MENVILTISHFHSVKIRLGDFVRRLAQNVAAKIRLFSEKLRREDRLLRTT